MKTTLFFIALFTVQGLFSAEPAKPFPIKDFAPPFSGQLEIIGTFCELRPNHFHGGLDIRTGGKIGRHVLSIGDGYISRINISTTGYGKALYISHPNGYTSVYAHLHDFPEKIKWYITKNQYLLEKFEVELYPEPDLLKVSKGEMVAYSGNTGASQGPHLHFEIRETATEAPVNPLLCGIHMKDHLAPAILNLFLYRKDSDIKVHNGHYPSVSLPLYSTHTVGKGKKKRKKLIPITAHTFAYGTYAFGANLKDYATSLGDNNGVNYIKVYKDNELIYDCRIEKFLFSQMRMHNNYIDFRRQRETGIKMHKLFKDDGSTLFFWENSPGDGWFEIKDSSEHHFKIVVMDVYGHSTEKHIRIRGSKEGRTVKDYITYQKNTTLCHAAKDNLIHVNSDFRVFIPKNALYSDYKVSCVRNFGSNYSIGNNLVSLDKKFELHYRLSKEQIPLAGKFTVFGSDGKTYGGELKDQHWLAVPVKEFGTFNIVLDTIRPTIKPISMNKKGYFSFQVSDATSGIKDYDFYVNGKWVLLEYMSGLVYGRLPTALPSGNNTIVLKVRDNRNNERTYLKIIYTP